MGAMITFFPVGCGDMSLVRLADEPGTFVLVDVNIRAAADNPDDDTRDVGKDLRDRLPHDAKGRPYVDAFLLSHPDKDHCTGLEKHFHLGPINDYPDDDRLDAEKRIVIREIWSSPIVFRRASKTHTLCSDAYPSVRTDPASRRACSAGIGSVDERRQGSRTSMVGSAHWHPGSIRSCRRTRPASRASVTRQSSASAKSWNGPEGSG